MSKTNQLLEVLLILLAYTTISHDVTVQCNGPKECSNDRIHANSSTNLLIECKNSSCEHLYISAVNASSLQLNCDSFSCRSSKIFCPTNKNSTCKVNCIGKHACRGFDINAKHSYSLSVKCDGESACDSSSIYSNIYHNNITCISTTDVCDNMWIYLYDNITFNSFNIECLSNSLSSVNKHIRNTISCPDFKLMCYDDPNTNAKLIFNKDIQQYICYENSSDCCPTNYTYYTTFTTPLALPPLHSNIVITMLLSVLSILLVIAVFCCIRRCIHRRNKRKAYSAIKAQSSASSAENANVELHQIEQHNIEQNDDMIVNQHDNIELDINNYHQWNPNQVQKYITEWIILRHEFSQYRNTLIKMLSEEEVDGECLKAVEISDINRWGIKNFKHSKELLKHIKILSDNQEGEIERSQEEGDEKTTRRESAVYFEINENEYNEQDNKEDILLDEMLSDILKMESLDPNKIHEMNVNNVIDKQNNDSDSENSDNMYE
eukprot:363686_1